MTQRYTMIWIIFLIIFFFVAFTGCSTTKLHIIKINSDPTGAKVVFDGKSQSDTPVRVTVEADGKAHWLFVTKNGCDEVRKVFRHNRYPGHVNITLTCEEDFGLKDSKSSDSDEQAALLAAERARQRQLEEEHIRDSQSQSIDSRSKFINEDIYFEYDSSFLTVEARRILQEKMKWLNANPTAQVIIQGHTDERGTVEYNLALGDRRAQGAKEFLMNSGIVGARLTALSFGEEFPVEPGHNETAWAKNRRVHFEIK